MRICVGYIPTIDVNDPDNYSQGLSNLQAVIFLKKLLRRFIGSNNFRNLVFDILFSTDD